MDRFVEGVENDGRYYHGAGTVCVAFYTTMRADECDYVNVVEIVDGSLVGLEADDESWLDVAEYYYFFS